MKRMSIYRTPIAVLALLVAGQTVLGAPVPEEKSPLGQVPATAPMVVHLNGVERTKDRIIALLEKALPDQAAVAASFLNTWFKDGVDGRKLQGVPKDGHVFVVFLEMPKD